MKCNEIKNLIMEYIDGELSENLSKDITKHLNTCQSCRRTEEYLRSVIIEPLRQAERIEVPERIWYQVKDTIVNKKEGFSIFRLITQLLGYFRNILLFQILHY